jgi:hypothetical protein
MLGAKDEELAKFLGIAVSTLNKWKHEHPELMESIKNGRDYADLRVADSLYQRSIGFVCKRQQPFKLKRTYYDDQGRRCEEERVEIAEYYDQVPPDTAAAFIWLKNRRPDKWVDKPVPKPEAVDQSQFEEALKGVATKIWTEDRPPIEAEEQP